ncbi:sialic acid-binding Ig-like lectin 12 isoform X2 [Gambusia affinis]|uniref:sialic acid-binding Ig-like lectin 12 isoform X2 n=1 Tax=Gambusia affinis TaxID=33528 RepID=UPI001CDB6A9C|nr:sialic acid-binding Ig-like lectin 12 isoform X2 [Gambusia affinis]
MLAESKQLMWTLLLLFVEDVFSNKCFVDYPQQTICAVRGSPVVFFCIFNYIEKQEVKKFRWGYVKSSKVRLILNYPGNVSERYEYTGDKEHNCSLKIHKVKHCDAGKYFFRYNNRRCPTKLLVLNVIDLNISLQKEAIKEGDSVNLTCKNRCDGEEGSYGYSWFKDGEAINEGQVLHLTNVSSKHSGNYTCSLKMKNGTTSGIVQVDVEYGPKNTSVLVRSSSEMGAGSSIVLICCSDAHPPVENYSWFKIAEGWTQKVGHQAELLPVHGGQYLCSVSNKHGSQNSTVFTLKKNCKYLTKVVAFYELVFGKCIKKFIRFYFLAFFFFFTAYWTFMRDMLVIISASVVLLLVVTSVIAVCRLTKIKMMAETEQLEAMQRTDGANRLRCEDSHQSQAVNDLKVEEDATEIIYATIEFQKGRKRTMN